MPSSTAPKTTKKPVRKAAPKIALSQTDLATLMRDSKSNKDATDKVLELLTRIEKQPPQIVVQSASATDVPASAHDSARLEALLTLFSSRSAQQVLQDMLETGRPPTREALLREADRMVAAR